MNLAKSRTSACALLFAAACLFPALDAMAAELNVCQSAPGPHDFTSIQDAVEAAHDGDVIRICAGMHTEAGILIADKMIQIRGSGGATTIQAAVQAADATNRVFAVTRSTVDFLGLTIAHGRCTNNPANDCEFQSKHGGGMFIEDSSVFLMDVRFRYNLASVQGGAIYLRSGDLLIRDCRFEHNQSGDFGGAIFTRAPGRASSSPHTRIKLSNSVLRQNTSGRGGGGLGAFATEVRIDQNSQILRNTVVEGYSTGGGVYFSTRDIAGVGPVGPSHELASLIVENAAISHNEARYGAGLYIDKRINPNATWDVQLRNVVFEDNDASSVGGAIFVGQKNWVELYSARIRSNEAADQAGGISLSKGKLIMVDSTVHGNESGTWGGGLNSKNSETEIRRSTISENRSRFGGGGIWGSGQMIIVNSTFSGNIAGTEGGGIRYRKGGPEFGTLEATNVTIAHNQPVGLFSERWARVKNSIIANNGRDCAGFIDDGGLPSLDSDGSCNFSLSNGNANLAALGPYGGSTETHKLLPGSDAIDSGNDATCDALPVNSEDQRQVPRPLGFHCDLGAVETEGVIEPVLVSLHMTGLGIGYAEWLFGLCNWDGVSQEQSGNCDGELNSLDIAQVRVTPQVGSEVGDLGPCDDLSLDPDGISFICSKDLSDGADWTPTIEFRLTVQWLLSIHSHPASSGSGTVSRSALPGDPIGFLECEILPMGETSPGDCIWNIDENIELHFIADADPDSVISEWEGCDAGMWWIADDGKTGTCSVTMDQNRTVTVRMDQEPEPESSTVEIRGNGPGQFVAFFGPAFENQCNHEGDGVMTGTCIIELPTGTLFFLDASVSTLFSQLIDLIGCANAVVGIPFTFASCDDFADGHMVITVETTNWGEPGDSPVLHIISHPDSTGTGNVMEPVWGIDCNLDGQATAGTCSMPAPPGVDTAHLQAAAQADDHLVSWDFCNLSSVVNGTCQILVQREWWIVVRFDSN